MIDLHCHVLPGVDDGSRNMEMSMEMARIAKKGGTDIIVATPHSNIPGLYRNYYGPWYDSLFEETKAVFAAYGIELLPGMEVFSTYDTPEYLDEGRFLTINQSRYLLIEFDFGISFANASDILNRVKDKGYIPLIAHAERFDFIKNSPHNAFLLSESGCVLQANKGSFLGDFGSTVQKTAYLLLKHGLYSVVASDAHNHSSRNTYLKDVYNELKYEVTSSLLDSLFNDNPQRIINDGEILQFEKYDFV